MRRVIDIGLSLGIFFIILSSVIMVYFGTVYEHGFGSNEASDLANEYCIAKGDVTACSGCNVTSGSGYETFLDTCHSLISRQNGTHCYACSDFGQRTTIRGIALILIVVGIIAFGMTVYKGRVKNPF